MGCLGSKGYTKEYELEILQSKEIDKELKVSQGEQNTVFKILLLGTGESGKSTIFKQMQLLYAEGFNAVEKQAFRLVIRRNVVDSILSLIGGVEKYDIPMSDRGEEAVAEIKTMDMADLSDWEPIATCVSTLWLPDARGKREVAFQKAYAKRSQLRIPDAAAYFLDAIDRISERSYQPTPDDIIRARLRTTGIVEKEFKINESHFIFVDVGGQRTERRKWIHCFDGVTAVIFMTAISEYNQAGLEDAATRLHESLDVFKQTVENKFLANVAFIIFFNKFDLFQTKIREEPLECFPDEKTTYKGDGSAQSVGEFIRDQFVKTSKSHKLYSHFTTATDTQNCERVFKDVKNYIHQMNMEECGLQ